MDWEDHMSQKRADSVSQRKVAMGEQVIPYELTYKRVKNINFRLGGDGVLRVSAGRGVSPEAVDDAVRAKGAWILRARRGLEAAQERLAMPHTFAEGERVSLLGEVVTLHFETGRRSAARRDDAVLTVTLPDPADEERRRRMVRAYAAALVSSVFEESLAAMLTLAAPLGIGRPRLRTRWMKSRWGTCHYRDGLIVLNKALVAVPRPVIDYVVLHELVHFCQPHHGRAFYQALDTLMPDHAARRAWLRQVSPLPWSRS